MIELLPIHTISYDEHNPRFKTDVTDLTESLKTIGMIQPILVNKEHKLIAGKRRLIAAKQLGWKEIPAFVVGLETLFQELASIDENIIRLPLNSIEYDDALLRRKVIFEEKFPQTRAGFAGGSQSKEPSFVTDTAQKLDLSKKSVELAINRAKWASPRVREARLMGLAPSKVNEIVTLSPALQDEVLGFVQDKSYTEVKDMVKRIKDSGLEKTLEAMKKTPALDLIGNLERDLVRLEKDFMSLMTTEEPLRITSRDKVFKRTKGLIKIMRSFLSKVKVENSHKLKTA